MAREPRGPAWGTFMLVAAGCAAWAAEARGQATGAQEPQSAVEEIITVTATRQPFDLNDIAAPATLVSGEAMRRRSVVGLDEALAWESGFSLLRRSPARAAHPTTQGLNLRGIAPSGTSRALVLVDGIPLTDAFGGWVMWSRVPPLLVEAVEIVPGGASSTFGNQALAGTLQFRTRQPRNAFDAAASAALGNLGTQRGGFVLGGAAGRARLLVAGDVLHTTGYVATAPEDAGDVDTEVGTEHLTAVGRAILGQFTVGADVVDESRRNGTPTQTNATSGWGLHGRWSPGATATGGQVSVAYRDQRFESLFSSIAADRDSEVAVLDQVVDSTDLAVGAQGWHDTGSGLNLGAGADWRRVEGVSTEKVLLAGFTRAPGGSQNIGGSYAAVQWTTPALAVEGALRLDTWRNEPNDDTLPRSLNEWSPRAGVIWRPAREWSFRAAAYRSFRAPTLNELYRQFRVGNVVTRANPDLVQERLRGVEAGVEYARRTGGAEIRVRLHGYANALEDAVINATVGTSGSLILRQRDNLGAATVRGLELGVDLAWSPFDLGANVTVIDSRIDEDLPGQLDSIVGNRLPQVPAYRTTIAGAWARGAWGLQLAVHATGEQFEDEQNQRPLASGATWDAAARWQPGPGWELALQAQNLLDSRLQVARTTVLSLGAPRTVTLQLAWQTGNP